MTDRDDELRRKLGWTGPEETDYEPAAAEPEPPTPPKRPVPSRPPVDYIAPDPPQPRSVRADDDRRARRPPLVPSRLARRRRRRPTTPARPSGARAARRQLPSTASPYGPPPGSPPRYRTAPRLRTAPERLPAVRPGRSQPAPWGQQPPQPPRPAAPAGARGPATDRTLRQPWPARRYAPGRAAPPPPSGSYADRIRADELVPARRVPPGRGWRLALYKATFGLVNLGQGPDEIRQAELEAKIRSVLRGHYKVGVMGKGGVGKTTVSASIGSVFAELRQDDRVVAIDADTAFGKLGSRVDPKAQGSYWELAADQHLETFADVRSRVGNNAAGLFVLAGEATPARRRVLDPAIYREATSRLDRYFTISIVDCSSTMDTPVTQEVLRDLDALIVVSSPWVDGAAAAGQTMDWLAARGLTGSAAAHRRRPQRLRRACRQADAFDSGATVLEPGPGRRRGAVRRAPAARRRHRPHQPRCRPRRGAASSRSPPRSPSTSRRTTTGAASATDAASVELVDQRFDRVAPPPRAPAPRPRRSRRPLRKRLRPGRFRGW